MTVTSTDIANQAIYYMGDNTQPVTGTAPNFDDSKAGVALRYLYEPCVQFVARQWEWDMARSSAALTASGNIAPGGWDYEYLYPTSAVQVWQLAPATQTDRNNPLPVNWVRGNTLVDGTQTSVIWSNLADAVAVFNNNPTENDWDAGFREAVVRLLASELAIALAGRPETSQVLFQSGSAALAAAKTRDS